MRKVRSGTYLFVAMAGAGIMALIVQGLRVGGSNRGMMYAGIAAASVAITAVALIVVGVRRRSRLHARVASGEVQWAADSLVFSGDDFLPGAHQPFAPPGPKGILTYHEGVFVWEPDPSTARKGFERFTIAAADANPTCVEVARDVLGFSVQTWKFHAPQGPVEFQLALQTGDLSAAMDDGDPRTRN